VKNVTPEEAREMIRQLDPEDKRGAQLFWAGYSLGRADADETFERLLAKRAKQLGEAP
jgi:hypothetical protein